MNRKAFTLVEILITILIIGILSVIAVPNYLTARSLSQGRTCIANLHAIESAKEQWAMEQKKGGTDVPTTDDLVGQAVGDGYIKSFPTCPAGGTYNVQNVQTRPTCSIGSPHILQ